MSKGKKILILVGLLILCTSGFSAFEKSGLRELAAFCAFSGVGLLAAIFYVAVSRGESRRR